MHTPKLFIFITNQYGKYVFTTYPSDPVLNLLIQRIYYLFYSFYVDLIYVPFTCFMCTSIDLCYCFLGEFTF